GVGRQGTWRTGGGSWVDGRRVARENVACRTEVACSHVSGLFTQSRWSAGPDGVHEPRPHHSITSSARVSSIGDIWSPSALAVLRLMTSSNLVGCTTGRSAGLVPLRILST